MELAVGNLIKIILGILVVAAIAYGLYYFFSNNVMDTFKNVNVNTTKFLLALY